MHRQDGSKKMKREKNCGLNSPDSLLSAFLSLSWLFRKMYTFDSEDESTMDTLVFFLEMMENVDHLSSVNVVL